jgi:lysophospholipase L1-like esterase
LNKYLKIFVLFLGSLALSVLIAEGIARLVFDPIDFLKPRRVSDDVLRYRIEPSTGAHDARGFRNKSVPGTAQVVAIGDSHTYGISARASESWPSVLGMITGKSVYNVSLGGYGPAEYLYLMETEALALHPEIIIAGFYLGNDIKDSFTAVYGVERWKDMRKPELVPFMENGESDDEGDFSYGIGDWLAGHSVLYRLVSSSFIGDNLRQARRIKRGERIVMLDDKENGIRTGFTPDQRLKGLDLARPDIKEGLELSLEFFNRMNELARENNIEFIVLIIPTKESVFARYIEGNKALPSSDRIDYLIENERQADSAVRKYFDEHGIRYVDAVGPLSGSAGVEQMYPNNFGGHENGNGYRIMAEAVKRYLDNL